MVESSVDVNLRVIVGAVPPNVRDGVETVFGLQDQDRALHVPLSVARDYAFDVPMTLRWTVEGFDFAGPFVHGKRGERFLYIGWRPADGKDDDWIRRWKIRLTSFPESVTDALSTRGAVQARVTTEYDRVWLEVEEWTGIDQRGAGVPPPSA